MTADSPGYGHTPVKQEIAIPFRTSDASDVQPVSPLKVARHLEPGVCGLPAPQQSVVTMPELEDVVVAFRTHHWDAAVDTCFQHLRRSTAARIVVCVDETQGPVRTPDGYPRIAHTTATFEAMGLPSLPSPAACLWYSGDYPLYQLLEQLEFRHLLMIEGDCAVTGSLDALLKRLIAEGVDYATRTFRRLRRKSDQYETTLQWFGNRLGTDQVFSGSFAALFLSRRAIENLYPARLEMAREQAPGPKDWVFCEAFAATQLHLRGFACRRLKDYADMSQSSYERALKPDEVTPSDADEVRFFHPVLDSPRYEQKLASYFKKLSLKQGRRVEALHASSDALRRKLMASQEALLQSRHKARAYRTKLEATREKLRSTRVSLQLAKKKLRFWRRSAWPAYVQAARRRMARLSASSD